MTNCEIKLTKDRIHLGGHDFREVKGYFKCTKCPLELDYYMMRAMIKKQKEN